MPSKRTNDSVDRILEELSHQQAREVVRDSVNDRKVDEILRSVGIDASAPGTGHTALGPIGKEDLPAVEIDGSEVETADRFSTAVLDDILRDLPSMQKLHHEKPPAAPARTQPAPRPAARPAQPVRPAESARPAAPQPAPQTARPVQQPAAPAQAAQPAPRPVEQPAPPAATSSLTGDTTRTSIIKNFLLKMAPGSGAAGTQQLNEGKEQFQQFFGKSAAVLPDENGKLRDPSQKRRGIFGLGKAEDTGEFVPINVSLGGRRAAEPAPEPQPAPAPQPDPVQADPFADALGETRTTPILTDTLDGIDATGPVRKKPGLFGGLFGRRAAAPAAMEDEAGDDTYASFHLEEADTGTMPQIPLEPAQEEQASKTVYHSKYSAARAGVEPPAVTSPSITLTGLREALRGSRPAREGVTGTIYRKKRNTVEFTPGQHKKRSQAPAEAENRAPEVTGPVGEPVMTPDASVQPQTTGFTTALDGAAQPAAENTQDFLAAAAEAARPVPQPEPEEPPRTARADTFEELDVDSAASLTGELHLADLAAGAADRETPAHSGFSAQLTPVQEEAEAARPETPAHSGFSAQLTPVEPEEETPAEPGQPSGFGADLPLNNRPAARPDTSDFVRGIAESINEGTADEPAQVEERFAKAAAVLTEEEAEPAQTARLPRAKKPRRPGIRLDGEPADETADGAEPPFEEDETPARRHEYEHTEDAPAVRRELDTQVLLLTVAAIVCGVAALVMIYLGTAATGAGLPMPAPLDPAVGATPLLATLLVLLLASAGLCWRTMLAGLRGLVKGATADSLPALAAVGAAVQLIMMLINPSWYRADELCLLAGPAALLLCFNAVGKRLDAVTTRENFRLVSAGNDHAVAYRLKDAGILRAVTKGLTESHPNVLVNRPTQLIKDFLGSSASRRTSDKNQQQFARLVGGVGLAALLYTLVARRDPGMAFTALAAVLCIGAPLAGTLLSALPARFMQRSAAQVGAVIPGWRDIRQLGRINVIQVSSQDLFPKGCVKLCGIRPVQKEHIDLAIVYAASLFSQGAPTMREVFLSMIGDNRKLLRQVDDFQTIYGKGYVGWIGGERVLAGNRQLMQQFEIELPSLEYEKRHTVNQRRVIYLAVSGKLYSMFLVAYQADPDTAVVLESLRRTGMSLLVDADDFNCDETLLEAAYNLPTGSVRVLDDKARQALEPAVAWLPESEGNMLHLGSFASFVGGLEAAAGAAEGERKAAMVLSASVLLSCVLAVVMVLAGGIAALPLPALVLYQGAWAVLALIFPMLQRY